MKPLKNFHVINKAEDELWILRFSLKQAIEPKTLINTNNFSTFESIHRTLSRDLKYEGQSVELMHRYQIWQMFTGRLINLPKTL